MPPMARHSKNVQVPVVWFLVSAHSKRAAASDSNTLAHQLVNVCNIIDTVVCSATCAAQCVRWLLLTGCLHSNVAWVKLECDVAGDSMNMWGCRLALLLLAQPCSADAITITMPGLGLIDCNRTAREGLAVCDNGHRHRAKAAQLMYAAAQKEPLMLSINLKN